MRYGVLIAALLSVSAFADEANTRTIAAPRDAVWQKVVSALMKGGYPITNIDKNSGLITTAPKQMKVGMDKADCGRGLFGIPYQPDPRTITTVAYNIMLTPQGEATQAMVVGTIAGTFDAAGNPTKILTCKSLGVLEKELLDAMAAP